MDDLVALCEDGTIWMHRGDLDWSEISGIPLEGEDVRKDTVKHLAESLGIKCKDIIEHLNRNGIFSTVNQVVSKELELEIRHYFYPDTKRPKL